MWLRMVRHVLSRLVQEIWSLRMAGYGPQSNAVKDAVKRRERISRRWPRAFESN